MSKHYRVVAATDAAACPVQACNGLAWCRLDDQIIYWQLDDADTDMTDIAPGAGVMHPTLQGQPYLVVQVGNAFLVEHPDARVLLNKGRYLIVDLEPAELAALRAEDEEACFGMIPLPAGQVVLKPLALDRSGARVQQPAIAALTAQVSQARLLQTVNSLTAWRSRHSASAEFVQAAEWCRSRLASLGFGAVAIPVALSSGSSLNIVADKRGSGSPPRRLWLLTAHLDSINHAGGAGAAAPGADDNASGVAGALEIAQLLAPQALNDDFRVLLFGGEEQGLRGSRQYVAALPAAERARIAGVINMDMIARQNTGSPTVMLEGAPLSQGLIDALAAAAADYTGLAVQTSLTPFASDHVPFIDAGLPAVLTIEGADSSNHDIHTAADTADKLHAGLAQQIVQLNLAVLAQGLGLAAGAPRSSSGPVVTWGANRLDVFVIGSNRALFH
ncbi:M28 family metallopeptidase [Paucibacter sp. XJ19-41]|uniref:M28 family metallopeptidase n=1 Tax=Paucibacter sp. XJ19-41 TaxID=2927824 RepID=UPI00234A1A2E|nr:M28 family metallopeptidase [Paucibacter sp. XJ19-41]MDC6171081.1 M28 family metallopeptidase [Paucibacter sp. XJ19-41]